MFRAELYKIASRKVTVIYHIILLPVMLVLFSMSLGENVVIEDGSLMTRSAAIKRNKEITAPYEGVLSMDKVMAVWEKYGPPYNPLDPDLNFDAAAGWADESIMDNDMNVFVAGHFFSQEYKDTQINYIPLLQEEVSEYFADDLHFGYTGGWSGFGSFYYEILILVSLLIVIALSPVIAEEYSRRTSDIILTTQNGRGRLFRIKTAAACTYSSLVYWFYAGLLFLFYGASYGWSSLKVSVIFTEIPYQYASAAIGKVLLILYLCGWGASVALALLVTAVSAKSSQTFHSLLWSLFLYLFPLFFEMIVLSPLRPTPVVNFLKTLAYSMPVDYARKFLPETYDQRILYTGILVMAAIVSVWAGRRKYCRHQV